MIHLGCCSLTRTLLALPEPDFVEQVVQPSSEQAQEVPESSRPEVDRLLWLAAEKGNEKLTRELLDGGASTNWTSPSNGFQALHVAAGYNRTAVLRLLLDRGVSVDSPVASGNATALHLAAFRGNVDCVKILLERRADVNARAMDNATALHLARYTTTTTMLSCRLIQDARELTVEWSQCRRISVDCETTARGTSRYKHCRGTTVASHRIASHRIQAHAAGVDCLRSSRRHKARRLKWPVRPRFAPSLSLSWRHGNKKEQPRH